MGGYDDTMEMTMLSYHSIYYVSAARNAGVTEYLIHATNLQLVVDIGSMEFGVCNFIIFIEILSVCVWTCDLDIFHRE